MKRRAKGLTLIELMVTLAVAIVLLGIGIPAFNAFSARDISTSTVNALVTALHNARLEAVSRGANASVCAAVAPGDYSSCGDAGTDWVNGWFAFAEPRNRDGVFVAGDGDELIRQFPQPRREITIAVAGIDPAHLLQFDSQGMSQAGAEARFTVSTYPSGDHSDPTKRVKIVDVVVSPTGQVRTEVVK